MNTVTLLAQMVSEISEHCESIQNDLSSLRKKLIEVEKERDEYLAELKLLGRK